MQERKWTLIEIAFAAAATIVLLLAFASCCPKVVPTSTTTRDTIVSYQRDTILIPQVRDSFSLDMRNFCDSLWKNIKEPTAKPYIKEIRAKNNANASLRIVVDSTGRAELIAVIDSIRYVSDSLTKVIRVSEKTDRLSVVHKCVSGFHRFVVTWFFASIVGAILLFVLRR